MDMYYPKLRIFERNSHQIKNIKKGLDHPKNHSLNLMLFDTCIIVYLLLNTKRRYFKECFNCFCNSTLKTTLDFSTSLYYIKTFLKIFVLP